MKNKINQFLGSRSPEEFLENYWDKKFLHVKNAVNNMTELSSKEELFDFATSEDVESRIVSIKNQKVEALSGPFTKNDYSSLGEENWTLLNQGMNRFSPKIAELEKLVSFIPNWKFDDVMVSYANNGGGVGPHTDRYNVFIIQGEGRRTWKIQYEPDKIIDEECDILQLKNFKTDFEVVLEAGDMIYIPPNVGHYGISQGESLSYSIGFRSFDHSELVKNFSHHLLTSFNNEEFYTEMNPKVESSEYSISLKNEEELSEIIINEFKKSDNINNWILSYLSEPKEFIEENDADFLSEIALGKKLYVDTGTKFLIKNNLFYVNGISYEVEKSVKSDLLVILKHHPTEQINTERITSNKTLLTLAIKLYLSGALFFSE